MGLDLQEFGVKLRKYRDQLKLTISELADRTGISENRLEQFEAGQSAPSGDEVLIVSDFYHCDYRFFISNERLAPFEQTENLYRRYGNEFSKEDRWRVQEFLFLCECEEQLKRALNRPNREFTYRPKGNYFKGHAEDAAKRLRQYFGYGDDRIPSDIYRDLRSLGIHILRRKLENSNVSGLTVRHPFAGNCILVNWSRFDGQGRRCCLLQAVERQRSRRGSSQHLCIEIPATSGTVKEVNSRPVGQRRSNSVGQ
jgi:transcriptional regulator with XRE-family HTH domain